MLLVRLGLLQLFEWFLLDGLFYTEVQRCPARRAHDTIRADTPTFTASRSTGSARNAKCATFAASRSTGSARNARCGTFYKSDARQSTREAIAENSHRHARKGGAWAPPFDTKRS
jgi:hypothetical protein